MIAIIEAWRVGLFHRDNIWRNVLAGMVVAIIGLPLAVAFAIASGAKPEAGIYTSIVAGATVSIFGGSRVQISGPTSAFIGVLVGVSSIYGFEGLRVATIMAGIMMFFFGVFKCGRMIKFIPEQVIVGFTAGIAVNMLAGQIPNFFGMHCENLPTDLIGRIMTFAKTFRTFDLSTTILASISLIFMLTYRWTFLKKVPAPLIALSFGVIIQAIFKFDKVATIGSVFGGLPSKLPTLTALSFPPSIIPKLLAPAFTIAMLGSIESLLCAVISDNLTGVKHSSDQELIGHGIGNVASSLFGGIPSTGSIARTVTSVRIGGNCPIAGLSCAFFLCLTLYCMAPLAKFIPLSVLSAILFVVAVKMMNCKHFYSLLVHAPKSDAIVLVLTFALTLFCGIVIAVNVGIMLSALMLMHRMAGSSLIERAKGAKRLEYDFSKLPEGIAVYTIVGPIFFGMTDKFSSALSSIGNDERIIILRMFDVPFIDATGLEILKSAISAFKRQGRAILLSEATGAVMSKLKRSHMGDSLILKTANLSIVEIIDIATEKLNS
ncbi:MAG: STAS domain-containing protein [Puniceicoccales bacterium]|jgi:SulP family sulfate permease|nr:STAS domain-containing protein [Puniceicoccales bacterium]